MLFSPSPRPEQSLSWSCSCNRKLSIGEGRQQWGLRSRDRQQEEAAQRAGSRRSRWDVRQMVVGQVLGHAGTVGRGRHWGIEVLWGTWKRGKGQRQGAGGAGAAGEVGSREASDGAAGSKGQGAGHLAPLVPGPAKRLP